MQFNNPSEYCRIKISIRHIRFDHNLMVDGCQPQFNTTFAYFPQRQAVQNSSRNTHLQSTPLLHWIVALKFDEQYAINRHGIFGKISHSHMGLV